MASSQQCAWSLGWEGSINAGSSPRLDVEGTWAKTRRGRRTQLPTPHQIDTHPQGEARRVSTGEFAIYVRKGTHCALRCHRCRPPNFKSGEVEQRGAPSGSLRRSYAAPKSQALSDVFLWGIGGGYGAVRIYWPQSHLGLHAGRVEEEAVHRHLNDQPAVLSSRDQEHLQLIDRSNRGTAHLELAEEASHHMGPIVRHVASIDRRLHEVGFFSPHFGRLLWDGARLVAQYGRCTTRGRAAVAASKWKRPRCVTHAPLSISTFPALKMLKRVLDCEADDGSMSRLVRSAQLSLAISTLGPLLKSFAH